MKKRRSNSVQEWLPFEDILENGIIKLKNNSYIKILKVSPINFNLKSNLEKEAILNSYKIFLKTCNFDIQILIQSKKEDLSKHIFKVKKINEKEDEKIINIAEQYVKYIKENNKQKKSSSKNFYIILKEKSQENKNNFNNEKIICEKLNDNFFKMKECLTRCGNITRNISDETEIEDILFSFFNTRKELLKN